MKKIFFTALLIGGIAFGQQIKFEEYKLDNGLHVILHQDNTAPVVTTGVMYHVGSKDENPERTGFAHFFEHLLFEGTENIGRGEWFKIVSKHGGSNNANTSNDRTYYYETFPSNNLALGLWMESERLLHPIINQIGVDTQNEVVKEEKRQRYDNSPYGKIFPSVLENVFEKHPYRWSPIGEMEHLDAATLEEFRAFNKKWYIPNNAVLVVAGDIDIAEAKELIKAYFGDIPSGPKVERNYPKETPITTEKTVTVYDNNIQVPMVITAYRTPSNKDQESYALDMLSTYLSDGKSSVLYKKIVDTDKKALQVFAQNIGFEDYGIYFIGALPLGDISLDDLADSFNVELKKVQEDLISEEDYQKLLNIMENNYVNSNSTVQSVAHSLADAYMLKGDTNLVNTELSRYQKVTREDIRNVAKKYLSPNQRVIIHYLPSEKK